MAGIEVCLRDIGMSIADSAGGEIVSCTLRPEGKGFVCTAEVFPGLAGNLADRLKQMGASEIAASDDRVTLVFPVDGEDQFAVVASATTLLAKGAAYVHTIFQYNTGNTHDPFTIMEDEPGSAGLTVQTSNDAVLKAYVAELEDSGLCDYTRALPYGDVDVKLSDASMEDRPAAFLKMAELYEQVRVGA